MEKDLSQSIEAILFALSEPQSTKYLAEKLDATTEEVTDGFEKLGKRLEGSGIMLVVHDNKATLATRPEYSATIETIRKEELQKELSRASAETLAIIAYHPEATKAQIEFIRGVNSSYSLRILQIRGLVEQKGGGRSVTYAPTLEMLEHFGVKSIEELPNYSETKQKIGVLLNQNQQEEPTNL
jgi:segregation and condensation protein B